MAAKKKRPRRKPADERKEEIMRLRVTAEQKEFLTAAAKKAGQTASQFLLRAGLDEAERRQRPVNS